MSETTPKEPGGPYYSRRSWQISAAALVVLLGLGAATVLSSGGGDESAPRAAASPSPSGTASTGGAAAGAEGDQCPRLPESTEIPASGPDVTWALAGPMALPASAATGPAKVDEEAGVARCYAHSPAGALVAATQISTRYVTARDWERVMREQTYGPGLDDLLKKRQSFMATAAPASPAPGELGQIAGYQVVTYTPETAVLQLVTRFDTGTLQESTVSVRWTDGDWRYQLPETGPAPKVVKDLDGYHAWGGV